MPQTRHLEAASVGTDCAIYRTLAGRARNTFEQSQASERRFSEALKARRKELTQCAKLRGVNLNGSDQGESEAAQLCPNAYDLWIRTGYRLRTLREDREGAATSIELLSATVDRLCRAPDVKKASLK